MPDPENYVPQPISHVLRGTTILQFLGQKRCTAREVSDATAIPLTTVIRMAAVMRDDQILNARIEHGELWLSMRYRHTSMIHLNK